MTSSEAVAADIAVNNKCFNSSLATDKAERIAVGKKLSVYT